MKDRRRILADAERCLMCHQPICNKACPSGVKPTSIIQSLHLDYVEGSRLRASEQTACLSCENAPCEKACARGRIDHTIQIKDICSVFSATKTPDNKVRASRSTTTQPDLSVYFCGVKCESPFFLASSPVASSYDMCCRAFDQGWAGVSYKTISFYQSREVSPRFDALPSPRPARFQGFKNLEQLSPHTAEENFDILRRLKQKYPEKIIIASIMGQTEEEWTRLASMTHKAGADMIECNFSCPQMAKQGLGSDIGQDPELISLYTQATRRGTSKPIIAKMTPNTGNMELAGIAAVSNGADALAAINTIKSITRINSLNCTSYPNIDGLSAVGGYSGAAVKPIALRFIHDLASYPPLARTALFGIGGITTWRDALDFLLLGCSALQI